MAKDKEDGGGANQPEAKFRYGGISAAVFVNQARRLDGSHFTVRKTVLQKTYMDESGQFQTTSSLGLNDLPKAVVALQRAYEHCLMVQREDAVEESADRS